MSDEEEVFGFVSQTPPPKSPSAELRTGFFLKEEGRMGLDERIKRNWWYMIEAWMG